MFETIEQYQAAFDAAPDKEQFLAQNGDGANLPTEAEKASTVLATPEESAMMNDPANWQDPADFDVSQLPTQAEVEPATEEEVAQFAEYERQMQDAARQGELDSIRMDIEDQYALRDETGEKLVNPMTGEVLRRDLSAFEKIDNSIRNIGKQLQAAVPSMAIGTATIYEKLLGREKLDELIAGAQAKKERGEDMGMWEEGWLDLSDEAIAEDLHKKRVAEASMGQTGSITEGIKSGDLGELAAGIVNGITSIGSSAVINTMTLGAGIPIQFTGDYYTSYNEELAKEKGMSLEELREAGEDEIDAPLAFGMLAGLSERVGLSGAGKAITGKVAGSFGKKVAHRLLSGNKEGLTELFQTGLEAANTANAKGEDMSEAFAERVFSEEGLESYLQGFAGGATLAGKGQDAAANIQKIQKAASAMRAPMDVNRMNELLEKEAHLTITKKGATDPMVIKNIDAEINEGRKEITYLAAKGNSVVQKMTDEQIDKAATVADAARGFVAESRELTAKFREGQITQDEYNAAYDGLKLQLSKKKAQLAKIAEQASEQQNQTEKDLTTKKPRSAWQTQTAPEINKIAEKNIVDGKISPEGVFEILQSPKVVDVVKAAIRKRIAAQGQEYDPVLAEELESEMLYGGKQSIHGLLTSWDGSKGAAPASYIYGQIQNKLTGKLAKLEDKTQRGAVQIDKQTDQGHGIQLQDPEVGEIGTPTDTRRRTANEQAARLGIGQAFETEMAPKMEALTVDAMKTPDKKFESTFINRFRKNFKPAVQKVMGKKADYDQWLADHAEELLNIYSARTLSKKRDDEAYAWIEKPPTVEEFIEYHAPKQIVAGELKRDPRESRRKARLAEAISEAIGLRAMEDSINAQQEQTTRDRVNAGFDNIINTLRKLQGERGTLQSNPLGIVPAALEGAVLATKAAFNAGMDMGNAIQKGYEKIADQVDFDKYKKWVEDQIKALKSPTSWAEMTQERVQQEMKLAAAEVARAVDPESSFDDNLAQETHYDQFTPSEDPTYMDLVGGTAQWKKFLADKGIKAMVGPKTDLEAYRKFVTETLTKYFPKEFFTNNNNFTVGYKDDSKLESAIGRGVPYTGESLNAMVAENEGKFTYRDDFGIKADFAAFKKVSFNSSNVFGVFQRGSIKAQQENNMNCLNYFAKAVEKMVADDPAVAPFIPGLLQQFSNNQSGLIRASAPVKGASTAFVAGHGGKVEVEEHTMPQNLVGRYILAMALEGTVDQGFPNVRRNYFQVLLSKADDDKLKGTNPETGEKFDYVAKMPVGWRMTDNVWARYFNDNVLKANGGIDPNSIFLFDEMKTVAQKYGADITADVSNAPWAKKYRANLENAIKKIRNGKKLGQGDIANIPDAVVEAQGLKVNEKVTDQVEQTIDKIIGAIEKLTGPKGALQANIAAVPLHVLVGGLRAAKLAYRGARNLAEAVEAGYQHVKEFMSRQEWADFTSKAIQEVKNKETGRTEGLRWASENAIKLEQQKQVKEKLNDEVEAGKSHRLAAFDFDDTLFKTHSNVIVNKPDGTTYKLTAEEFAKHQLPEGDKYDFSEFDQVVKPEALQGMNELKKRLEAGDDITILTARTMKAGGPIMQLMEAHLGPKAKKIKFIGVGSSSPQAKANYLTRAINKYGYKNVYFTDDAIGNVKGVEAALNNVENVESRVKLAQAVGIDYLNDQFNNIIEQKSKGQIKAGKVYGRGDIGKGKKLNWVRKFFAHPSAEDLKGLIYTILPSGKEGDAAWKFFEDSILRPYQRGVTQMNAYKANLHAGTKLANKLASNAKLNKTIPGMVHSWNNAARVAMASRLGQELTGIDGETAENLIAAIEADPKMSAYVDKMLELFDGEFQWNPKDINRPLNGELAGMADKVKRKDFLSEAFTNMDQVFSEENLNKIEAAAGREVRDNLEKTLARMKSGKNRTISSDSSTNKLLDWVNNATAMIMFTNMRSAALQTLSMFNYVNTGGNNIFQAGKHLANRKQYKEDVKMLWNSDYLRGRRGGLGFDIAADEIAAAAQDANGVSNLMDKVRQLGFAPTQIMDSFAISRGGALYYRTRLNKYKAEGHANPEQAAMDDFVALTEESQQSADPSKISQIQAGPLGRIIFAFGNTPFQYARVVKRAIQDLSSGRGNPANNLARIAYYAGGQAMLFNILQQALWLGDDDEKEEKTDRAILGAITSFIKSLGLGGAAAATAISVLNETQKEGRKDYVGAVASVSPPISAKLRQLGKAANAISKEDYGEAAVQGIEAIANVPTARVQTKFNNLQDLVTDDLTGTEMLLKTLGWSDYALSRSGDDDEPVRSRAPRRTSRKRVTRGRPERSSRPRRSPNRRLDSPMYLLKDGELGQAHDDGTIEVAEGLSPEERKKTINHEQRHIDDMESGKLSYTDNHIMWNGKKYPRKDGMIHQGGSWKPEGDKSFPWERVATKAEGGPERTDAVIVNDSDKQSPNKFFGRMGAQNRLKQIGGGLRNWKEKFKTNLLNKAESGQLTQGLQIPKIEGLPQAPGGSAPLTPEADQSNQMAQEQAEKIQTMEGQITEIEGQIQQTQDEGMKERQSIQTGVQDAFSKAAEQIGQIKTGDSPMMNVDPTKKKKKKKQTLHSLYAPGYTKHMPWAGARENYQKGLAGSEGGQGGLLYSQHRKNPEKMGGTTYTAGIMQNSYGDPIVAGTVGREWDLGKGWKAGVHGGATYGYGKSFEDNIDKNVDRNFNKLYPDGMGKGQDPAVWKANERARIEQGQDPFSASVRKTNIMPVVTGSIEKQFGDSGFGAKALINPLYVNAGLTYNFPKKKKRGKKK